LYSTTTGSYSSTGFHPYTYSHSSTGFPYSTDTCADYTSTCDDV
jgi:hypothetical protein